VSDKDMINDTRTDPRQTIRAITDRRKKNKEVFAGFTESFGFRKFEERRLGKERRASNGRP